MTYCLGIVLPVGLVLAADSRSNAGVDQVTRVRKFDAITLPDNRVIVILSAGNLATTQSVTTQLREILGTGHAQDLYACRTMFEVARIVGDKLREVVAHDGPSVRSYGDPSGSFLVGGQIKGEKPRLFMVYAAGNFIEASLRSCFLQIGETKYGKPILDRVLTQDCSLDQAAKLALLSFDATLRSNLSCGMPIDVLRYETDSFSVANHATLKEDDPYWNALRNGFAEGLSGVINSLPLPPVWGR